MLPDVRRDVLPYQLEFQPGSLADQFDGPLRILDAGKLDNDMLMPSRWMTGSETPNWSILLRIVSKAC